MTRRSKEKAPTTSLPNKTTLIVPILRLVPLILGDGDEIKDEVIALVDSILSSLTPSEPNSDSSPTSELNQNDAQTLAQAIHAINRLRVEASENVSKWVETLLSGDEGSHWLKDGEVMSAFVELVASR